MISEFFRTYGGLFPGAGAMVLAWAVNNARLELKRHTQTRVKANLAFEEVAERKPEYRRTYEALFPKENHG